MNGRPSTPRRRTNEAYSAGPPVVPAAPEPRRIASITSRVWPSWLAANTLTSTVGAAALALFANVTASIVLSTLVSFGPAVWMRRTFFWGADGAGATAIRTASRTPSARFMTRFLPLSGAWKSIASSGSIHIRHSGRYENRPGKNQQDVDGLSKHRFVELAVQL